MTGNELFGTDIAGIINDAMADGLLPATLVKRTIGTRTPGALSGGTHPVSTSYPCRGFIDGGTVHEVPPGMAQATTFTVLVIGNSIAGGSVAPDPGDLFTIGGQTFEVVSVDGDPANATYLMVVK